MREPWVRIESVAPPQGWRRCIYLGYGRRGVVWGSARMQRTGRMPFSVAVQVLEQLHMLGYRDLHVLGLWSEHFDLDVSTHNDYIVHRTTARDLQIPADACL